jgi:ribosomal protein S18 acetylase RimI-like enzyme
VTVTFRAATHDEYLAYRGGAADDYAAQMVELGGLDPEIARAKADADLAEQLPVDGLLDTHTLTVAEEFGHRVGIVWIGPSRDKRPGPWINDVAVDEQHRGRGFGRALMVEAERQVREAGGTHLGLNVFGGNTVAIALYTSLGYRVDAQQMSKQLTDD